MYVLHKTTKFEETVVNPTGITTRTTIMFSSILRSSTVRSSATSAFRRAPRAFFSDGSHSDFAPQRKTVEGEDEAIQMIKVCQ